MGTTSQKLSYLNDTKGKLKDSINKFRDGITDQTTFRDYATELDGIYDKLPKVDNTSDASRLLNAQNGKLDSFGMDGNTEQTTYSGKNLCGIPNQTFTHNNVNVTILDGEITLNGTANSTGTKMLDPINTTILNGSYTLNKIYISGTAVKPDSTNYGNFNIRKQSDGTIIDGTQCNYNAENNNMNKTFSENTSIVFGIYITNNTTYTNYKFKPQLVVGNTEDYNFEPYVGGTPSPNPDYPQNINVVSGNQVVNVSGKNLFDGLVEEGQYNTSTGAKQVGTNLRSVNYIPIKSNSTIKFSIDGESKAINILEYKGDYTFIQYTNVSANNTITLTNETKFITLYRGAGDGSEKWQIEYGSTATSYEPYHNQNYEIDLGDIKLCKIGDNQDYLYKTSGKNLFDKNNITKLNGTINAGSNTFEGGGSNYAVCISCKPNTTYTVTKRNDGNANRFALASSETIPSSTTSTITPVLNRLRNDNSATITLTTGITANYLIVQYYRSTESTLTEQQILDSIQIEEGPTATDYEPYGTDWYIKKEIGKVVLDGSESWGYGGSSTPNVFYTTVITDYATSNNIPYSNYYIGNTNVNGASGMSSLANNTIAFINVSGGTTPRFYIKDTKYTLSADLKTWLETHNLIVYYALITPTYETITNETLISQLESIKVNTGSNYFTLSNSNNVLPNIYAKRLKKLDSLT